MRGEDVSVVQQLLKDQGYFTYHQITGYFGTITEAAVKAFQKANGLVADGIVGPVTGGVMNKILAGPSHNENTGDVYTVQPGDSLWRIAARTLGPGASDADIDNSWRAWYFTNQQVVGDDPDQIVPGQQLTAPTVAGQVRS